jgi:hypothetical protein
MPAAIFVIPYADLMFAIIRRTRAGKPIMVADRQHLHHRLLNIGHSYRQSVLLMYLWAALFSVTVVSLSLVRSPSVVFAVATVVAVLALLPATMPRLRPRWVFSRRKASSGGAVSGAATPGAAASGYDSFPGYSRDGDPFPPGPPFPAAHPFPGAGRGPDFPAAGRVAEADHAGPAPGYSLPQPPRRPGAEPFVSPAPFSGQVAFPQFPLPDREPFPDPGPFPDRGPFQAPEPIPGQHPFNGEVPFPGVGPGYVDEPLDRPDPFSQAQPPDMRPN